MSGQGGENDPCRIGRKKIGRIARQSSCMVAPMVPLAELPALRCLAFHADLRRIGWVGDGISLVLNRFVVQVLLCFEKYRRVR